MLPALDGELGDALDELGYGMPCAAAAVANSLCSSR